MARRLHNKPLTQKQKNVLYFIIVSIKGRGIPPTVAEVADCFGFSSVTSAQAHIQALIRRGCIEREPGKSRSIKLNEGIINGLITADKDSTKSAWNHV